MLIKLVTKEEIAMLVKAVDNFIDFSLTEGKVNPCENNDPTFLAAVNLRSKMQVYLENNPTKV